MAPDIVPRIQEARLRTALEVSHVLGVAGPHINIKWASQAVPTVICVQIEPCDDDGRVANQELPLPIPLQGLVFGYLIAVPEGQVVLNLSDVGLQGRHLDNVRVSVYMAKSLTARVKRPPPESDGRRGVDKLIATVDVTFKNATTIEPFWMSPRESDCLRICPNAGKLLLLNVPEGAVSEVDQPTNHEAFITHFFFLTPKAR